MRSYQALMKNFGPAATLNRLRRFRTRFSLVNSLLLHIISIIAFAAMYVALKHWLPQQVAVSDLESSIQLLGQVLALVVGVLLLGTTVSLSSYDGSDVLSSIHAEVATATNPFFTKFFASGPMRHKLDTAEFRRSLLLKARVDRLLFQKYSADESNPGWFILRPHWDCVWYQVASSPFSTSNRIASEFRQIQYLHEAVICANTVLKAIRSFRSSGGELVNQDSGTNGSKWFLEAFQAYPSELLLELPAEFAIDRAIATISLALNSEHYMQEEFRDHADNVDWAPFVLTTFQLEFVDYVKSMSQLVEKLQLLRWANVYRRIGNLSPEQGKRVANLLWLSELGELRAALGSIRAKIVTAHGAARYFHQIKNWSVPGVGVAFLVLVAMLCGWPYLKWAATPSLRLEGFILLYSAAIASLVESSGFLTRLLWNRRAAR
jgi:hypothetical protein